MRLTISLEFTSDWHIGSGSGRPGSVDRLARRDHDGLPFVPARALLGLWRDAAETLAASLERLPAPTGRTGGWPRLVEALFGSQPSTDRRADRAPVPGRLLLEPAHLGPDPLRRALLCHPHLREGLTFRSPSVRIDPSTGAAEEDKLFFVEHVRGGAQLRALAEVYELPTPLEAPVRTFLAAAAEGIRALGGKRRRGLGRVKVRVGEQPSATDALFRTLGAPPELPPLRAPPTATFLGGSAAKTGGSAGWSAWSLHIEALEPLQVHRRTLGNVVETWDRIPGTQVMAALAPSLQRAGLDLAGAFSSGALLIRDGIPTVLGARGLPAPRCLERDKYAAPSVEGPTEPAEPPSGAELLRCRWDPARPHFQQAQGLRDGQVAHGVSDGVLRLAKITPLVLPHNVIDDEAQRPTEAVGGVYSYEAIPPGTTFIAPVLARGLAADAVGRVLAALHGAELRLGRALHADYGRVRVTVESTLPPKPPPGPADELRILLVSPLLLRDAALRPSVEPNELVRALEQDLGVELDLVEHDTRAVRVESWQRSWGLPRPSLVAFAPGSCLLVRCRGAAPGSDVLDRLAREGLGDRRAEGFGELALNPACLMDPPPRVVTLHRAGAAAVSGTLDDLRATPFGALVLRETALAALARAVAAAPLPAAFRLRADESARSQVGALRDAVARAPAGKTAAAALAWAGSPPERGRERAARVRAWVREELERGFWTFITEADTSRAFLAWLDDPLRGQLADEGWRRTLDRFCQEAARGNRAGREGHHGA